MLLLRAYGVHGRPHHYNISVTIHSKMYLASECNPPGAMLFCCIAVTYNLIYRKTESRQLIIATKMYTPVCKSVWTQSSVYSKVWHPQCFMFGFLQSCKLHNNARFYNYVTYVIHTLGFKPWMYVHHKCTVEGVRLSTHTDIPLLLWHTQGDSGRRSLQLDWCSFLSVDHSLSYLPHTH